MPYYLFTVRLTTGKKVAAIRQLPQADIDAVWRQYEKVAEGHYRNSLQSFSVVQLSKLSPEVRKFIADQAKKPDYPPGWNDIAPAPPPRKSNYSKENNKPLGER